MTTRYTQPHARSHLHHRVAPAAVSLFSNCGAGDVGFGAAGFRFRIMAELVEGRLDVALRNHLNAEGIPGDLRKTWQAVVERWRMLHGATAPALVAACPPCQGMSTVRSDRGAEDDPDAGSRDDRNLLVLPISHITKALEPTFVVVENVTAFLRRKVRDPESGEGISAARLLVRLLADDYDHLSVRHRFGRLRSAAAAEAGVPHIRQARFTRGRPSPSYRPGAIPGSFPCAGPRR